MNERDIAIRTILGEAMGEGPQGWAAVAHVLRNRAADPRWPSAVQDVALQPKQFSAWNTGAGGNDLVNKYGPNSDPYQKVGLIYDQVMSGAIADPTGGATHYYSPAGMQALVDQGSQTNLMPNWLMAENTRRGGDPVTIGGHVFTGLAAGTPQPTGTPADVDIDALLAGWGRDEALTSAGEGLMQMAQAPEPTWLSKPQAQPYQPVRRENPYGGLLEQLRYG